MVGLSLRRSFATENIPTASPLKYQRRASVYVVVIGPLSGSFWGLPYRILDISHERELLRGLWVVYF